MSTDPLLQPFTLKHLTFPNRLMTSSREPAYPEDGGPKGRYRAYHVERAKAGIALTMTAGSVAVSRDGPPVFNNILAYRDEVIGITDRREGRDHDPQPQFSPEVMAMNLVPYMRSLQKRDVRFTVTWLLESVRQEGNMLIATIGSDYGGVSKEQRHDQIIVNHGTRPNDDLYHELIPHSSNAGAVNYHGLIDGKPQSRVENPDGRFQLFRIGDAVAARNTHAAIHDALRLVKDI